MLVENLTEYDLNLLEIFEDPVWFGEFMRETNDGSSEEEQYRPFNYRWYQKDLLTDRSEKIVVVGGRSVGKCSPGYERIYTDRGYERLDKIFRERPYFSVYSWTGEGFALKRGFVTKNPEKEEVFRVTTKSGRMFHGTAEHPMLTPDGYVEIENLKPGMRVATMRYLPDVHALDVFDWYELRFLGYLYGKVGRLFPGTFFPIKFNKQLQDMEAIAARFNTSLAVTDDRRVQLVSRATTIDGRVRGHPGYFLLSEVYERPIGFKKRSTGSKVVPFVKSLPPRLRLHSKQALKPFVEAFLSMCGVFNPPDMYFVCEGETLAQHMRDLLLRFGLRTLPQQQINKRMFKVVFEEPMEVVARLSIPGIKSVEAKEDFFDSPFVFEEIKSIESIGMDYTYAVRVLDTNTYISGDFYVHNSVVLEDMILYSLVNGDQQLKESPDQLFVTANVAQMTPVLDRVTSRLMNGEFYRSLRVDPNRSKGTIDVFSDRTYRLYARIAGKTGESNLVGLHVTRIFVDEAQLLPKRAYQQMLPTLNTWQQQKQIIMFGVPNGLTRGNVLWEADNLIKSYKKYRIPAHENPFFSRRDNEEALLQFGGEKGDDYVNLVLGRHGTPTSMPLPRESIVRETYDFFSYRFSGNDKNAGYTYRSLIKTPTLDKRYFSEGLVFAIDSGFVQSTVINIIGCDNKLIWRTLMRVTLTRINFPEQAEIISMLYNAYQPNKIIFDFGSGGGGLATSQILQEKYGLMNVDGVFFNRAIEIGTDVQGRPITQQFKEFAAGVFIRMVLAGELRFSELDIEGVNQIERLATQRRQDGTFRYFILSEQSRGEDGNDHIFASYLVFAGYSAMDVLSTNTKRKSTNLCTAAWLI